MFTISKFFDPILKNTLIKMPKKTTFPIGIGGGTHLTAFNELYDSTNEKHSLFKNLVNHNLTILKKLELSHLNKVYIEHRDIIMSKDDQPFEGTLHLDSFMDTENPCWTCVYYYHIDKSLIGGDLLFPPFAKYKPKENQIIYFDGSNSKHKISKLFGSGMRGTIICSILRPSYNISYDYNENDKKYITDTLA